MKLTITMNITVDGAMQGCGGPDEDHRGGFDRGGWTTPFFYDEAATFSTRSTSAPTPSCSAGGPTRSLPAAAGAMADSGNPIAATLDTRPKYVASTTLTDPQGADTTVLAGDVAAAFGELNAKPEGELQVNVSGSLVRWLVDNHLVDEINLLTHPVIVGQDARRFPTPARTQRLNWSTRSPLRRGYRFRSTGRAQYAQAAPDPKQ